MLRFYLKKSFKDVLGHIILICVPIILIAFFKYIYGKGVLDTGIDNNFGMILAIGFALTFQIYGSAISVETLAQDFLTPMHDRILSTPANPQKLVSTILLTSVVVSCVQTLVIIFFSILILKTSFTSLFVIIIILFISVIFHQLLGTIILFLTKQLKTASTITTVYAIIAPMIAGLYFPLPKGQVFTYLKSYSTPMSLTQTAIFGVLNKDYLDVFIGLAPIIALIIIFIILIKPLSKWVIS